MKEKERSKRMERVKSAKRDITGRGKDMIYCRYITTGKGERKLKGKGKER